MAEDLVVIGAGGFGRETLDVIEAINAATNVTFWNVIGVIDDNPSELHLSRLQARGYRYLGPLDPQERAAVIDSANLFYTVGVGVPAVRRMLAAKAENMGWSPATLVHPSASVGSCAVIVGGVVICAGVQVSTNVRLGPHVHLNPGSIVGHDSELGPFVSVNPGAVVSGEVSVGSEALVGAGATILQGLRVGERAIVGAMACVTRDVLPGVVAKGVPARAS